MKFEKTPLLNFTNSLEQRAIQFYDHMYNHPLTEAAPVKDLFMEACSIAWDRVLSDQDPNTQEA